MIKLEKDYFYPGQTFIIIAKKPSIDKTYIELKTKISDCIRFLNKKLRKDFAYLRKPSIVPKAYQASLEEMKRRTFFREGLNNYVNKIQKIIIIHF